MATGRLQNTSKTFWLRVDRRGPDDCWPWLLSTKNGYGRFTRNYKEEYAHRVAYQEENGEIPEDLQVMHSCNNKVCCNPRHLVAGTGSENTLAAYDDGLAKNGERHPRAKLTEEQVREIYHSNLTQWELARKFGVRQNSISRIKLRQSWRHLNMDME